MSQLPYDPERDFWVTYDPPPIPIRCFDWSAVTIWHDYGAPEGWGATREAAIADLLEKLAEQAAEENINANDSQMV